MLTANEKTALVSEAFGSVFNVGNLNIGGAFIAIAILLFAFSTVLGWSYYGTKAWEFLFGTKSTIIYKVVFVVFIVFGATMSLDLAWDISDTFNGLMAIPNLIGVLTLSGTVIKITKNYVDRTFHGSKEKPMLSAFLDVQAEQEVKLSKEVA
jgi:AGCS family alanine or glycine:cation symporter